MLAGALCCTIGMAGVIVSDSLVVQLIGIPMAYGGLVFAFAGHQKWDERRRPVLHAYRCLPRLEAVLDPGTTTLTDTGAVTGRFRDHQIEVTGTRSTRSASSSPAPEGCLGSCTGTSRAGT